MTLRYNQGESALWVIKKVSQASPNASPTFKA
ncbi:hypothetical protein HDF22_004193 [Mucilaginibacter lappiensis]|uniref:Uncharacterized protein n=1 Tax=Mucilaginibacter lappiensis TaxID=354630 RepID=A0A841JHS6_9SPHI|nr:hypothetical protein [Mucilaginibacter lappiensis]